MAVSLSNVEEFRRILAHLSGLKTIAPEGPSS